MSEHRLTEILTKLVGSYSEKSELKEICISLHKTGQLTVGGRRMLISEILDEQPYEETVGSIQIIFASSADSHFADKIRDNTALTDELRELLINKGGGKATQKYLTTLPIESLVSVAPKIKQISFENQWKNT